MNSTTKPEDSDVVTGHDDPDHDDDATREHGDQSRIASSAVLEDEGIF